MAEMGFNYSQGEEKPLDEFEVIPVGWYQAMVTKSDVCKTQAGNGKYVSLRWDVIEGEYKGRKLFDNINIDNPNPKCVEIGRRQLESLCIAMAIPGISDSEELHNIPCWIRVRIRPAKGEYEAQNEIKAYRHINNPPEELASETPGGSSVSSDVEDAQEAPKPKKATPPWKK